MATREQIAEMACQAGFGGSQRRTLAVKLERLAALVAAAEREECAKECEGLWDLRDSDLARMHASKCAAAIRGRGQS